MKRHHSKASSSLVIVALHMLVCCSNEMNSRSLRLFGIVGCCAGANIVNILTTMILFATSHRCLSLCSKQHTTIISRVHRNAINFRQNSGSPICTRSSSLFAPNLQTISKHTSCKSTNCPDNGAASFSTASFEIKGKPKRKKPRNRGSHKAPAKYRADRVLANRGWGTRSQW